MQIIDLILICIDAIRLDYLTGHFKHLGSPGKIDVTGLIIQEFCSTALHLSIRFGIEY